MYGRDSPLLTMAAPSTPPAGLDAPAPQDASILYSASANSANTPKATAGASSSTRLVAFHAAPVRYGPSALGFGFGGVSTTESLPASVRSHTSPGGASRIRDDPADAAASHLVTRSLDSQVFLHRSHRSEGKRRRDSESDGDKDEEMEHGTEWTSGARGNYSPPLTSMVSSGAHRHASQNISMVAVLPKKMRTDLPSGSSSSVTPSFAGSLSKRQESIGHPQILSSASSTAELGTRLASLDKSELLLLFHRLVESADNQEALSKQILTLLPSPSFESAQAKLAEAEQAVRSAIPFSGDPATPLREEYIWSRVRRPLTNFTHVVLRYLPFFIQDESPAGKPLHSRSSPTLGNPEIHPATTFTFLEDVTTRMLRIEASLPRTHCEPFLVHSDSGFPLPSNRPFTPGWLTSPDPLITLLAPKILTQWSTLCFRISRQVNQEGRMFSQNLITNWMRGLSVMCSTDAPGGAEGLQSVGGAGIIRRALLQCRAQLEQDCGWLLGMREKSSAQPFYRSGSNRMDESTEQAESEVEL